MASQVENIKWVPGTKFIVDGFAFTRPQCQHYFLTHCHSDHTVGLRRRFEAGTIWCSPVSAKLLAAEWNLRAPTVRQLQLNQPTVIEGVSVTALDANHCPGAIMLLFEVPTGQGAVKRILHTGDCRWQDRLYSSSCLAHKPVDTLMLDTTYASPKHTFPPQEEAVSMMVQLMREALHDEPDTLMVVSSYHIGKERAYLGAAAALGLKVYVPAAKQRVLHMLNLPQQLLSVVSADPCSQLHVGWTSLAPDELQAYLEKQQQQDSRAWVRIMGFRATGWSYRRSGGLAVQRPSSTVALVGVPYSEHSSWHDLRQCVKTLKPKRIIPTVNAATRSQQEALVDRFADLMDLSGCRGRIDAYLVRPAPEQQPGAAAAAGSAVPFSCQAGGAAGDDSVSLRDGAPAAGSSVGGADSGLEPDRSYLGAVMHSPATQQPRLGTNLPSPTGDACAALPDAVSCEGWQQEPAAAHISLQRSLFIGQPGSKYMSGTVLDPFISGSAAVECGAYPCPQPALVCAALPSAPPADLALAPCPYPEQNGSFDFGSIDMSEQQRLLDDAERRQRLRKSLLSLQASKQKRRRKPLNSAGLSMKKPITLNKGQRKGQKQES